MPKVRIMGEWVSGWGFIKCDLLTNYHLETYSCDFFDPYSVYFCFYLFTFFNYCLAATQSPSHPCERDLNPRPLVPTQEVLPVKLLAPHPLSPWSNIISLETVIEISLHTLQNWRDLCRFDHSWILLQDMNKCLTSDVIFLFIFELLALWLLHIWFLSESCLITIAKNYSMTSFVCDMWANIHRTSNVSLGLQHLSYGAWAVNSKLILINALDLALEQTTFCARAWILV